LGNWDGEGGSGMDVLKREKRRRVD
jgi:hypothetical protein